MLDDDRHAREQGPRPTAAPNGDVNFAVRKFPGYGKLSGKSLDELRAGERVAVLDGKQIRSTSCCGRRPRRASPTTPSGRRPSAPGRPGWHIECSAMCCALLGEQFDIHGGGQDLQFPHHENEIAQSEGANGGPFVNYWMHNGFSTSTTRRCRSRSATSSPSATCCKQLRRRGDALLHAAHPLPQRAQLQRRQPRRRAAARCAALHRARRGARSTRRRSIDWTDGRAAALSRGDERRLQHADRGRGAVRARRRSEPQHDRAPSAALLQGPGRRRSACCSARRGLPAGGRGPRRGEHRGADRGAPRRQGARATSPRPTRSATQLAGQGVVLKDTAQGTTWVKG